MSSFNQIIRDALLTYLLEEHDIVADPNDLNSLIMQAADAYLEDPPVARHPGYIAGRWYAGYPLATTSTSALPAIDTIYFTPVLITKLFSFDQIKVNCITGAAGAILKVGLWNMDEATKKPIGAPIVADNTGLDCSVSATQPQVALSATLAPGRYWFGTKSGHLPAIQSFLSSNATGSWEFGRSNGASSTQCLGLSTPSAVGDAMPTLTGAETFTDITVSGAPLGWFRST